jgi:hypothetical protein
MDVMKANCWEFTKCERQPGGLLGYCWKVAGTLCGGKVEGTFAAMMRNCSSCCQFYHLVKNEEGINYTV